MKKQGTIIGIDLGGTKTAIALFDAKHMKQLSLNVFPTNASRGFAAVQESLLAEIARMRRDDTVGIGIGIPGMIDHQTETIVTLPNIPGAEGSEFEACIHDETGLPVAVDNDARCFAYAEALLGAGKGHAVVLGITMGTGVGGGIVIDGRIYRGSRGYAGEVGHMLLQPGRPPYQTDDRRGDIEQFLSGSAMGHRCSSASSPEDYLEGAVCGFMQPEVVREVAWLIVNALHSIDPSIIIFGGSAGRALGPHLPAVAAELPTWLLPGIRPPVLAIGSLTDAAVCGAALLVADLTPDPSPSRL